MPGGCHGASSPAAPEQRAGAVGCRSQDRRGPLGCRPNADRHPHRVGNVRAAGHRGRQRTRARRDALRLRAGDERDASPGVDVLHISRHRPGHALLSSSVTHQANIAALKERGADAILAVTVCGALDQDLSLGSLVVFDDLHFLTNRLPDGSICTLYTEPGEQGRGHWIYESPFSEPLRQALIEGAREAGHHVRDGGCYGHVDGPRFNTKTEIRMLRNCGVTVVSQTAGPETVLAGEAEIPYALIGYATDYANGVKAEATPVEELIRLIGASGETLASTLAAAVPKIDPDAARPRRHVLPLRLTGDRPAAPPPSHASARAASSRSYWRTHLRTALSETP